jgi:hypothetical protein
MAAGITGNRQHRASGDLAFHVLDIMQGFLDTSLSGVRYDLVSTVERPAAMRQNLPPDSVE